jgi:hypothetical protein
MYRKPIPMLSLGQISAVMQRVDRTGGPDACWPWHGQLAMNGYGTFAVVKDGRTYQFKAHRLVWALINGEQPPLDLDLDHTCRMKHCCNPRHLEAVTHSENVRRGMQARKDAAPGPVMADDDDQAQYCKNGHPWAETRSQRSGKGSRYRKCMQCARDQQAAYKARKQQQTKEAQA